MILAQFVMAVLVAVVATEDDDCKFFDKPPFSVYCYNDAMRLSYESFGSGIFYSQLNEVLDFFFLAQDSAEILFLTYKLIRAEIDSVLLVSPSLFFTYWRNLANETLLIASEWRC
jgi:hypothetical protein